MWPSTSLNAIGSRFIALIFKSNDKVGHESLIPREEVKCLLRLRDATEGETTDWTYQFLVCPGGPHMMDIGWKNNDDPRTWHGIRTSSCFPYHVEEVQFCDRGLIGKIPKSFPLAMGELLVLNLSNNRLEGSLPQSISHCKKLRVLNLRCNRLTGYFPKIVFTLSNLRELYLGYNFISGDLPEKFEALPDLEVLEACSNRLAGKLPTSLGRCSKLRVISLSSNLLSGGIPASFELLRNLEDIRLHNNRLEGDIPLFLGRLQRLRYLYLTRNRFKRFRQSYAVDGTAVIVCLQGKLQLQLMEVFRALYQEQCDRAQVRRGKPPQQLLCLASLSEDLIDYILTFVHPRHY